MTDLPAEVTFGKVVGRFRLAVPDSVDAGSTPDAQADSGTIKFVPRAPYQRVMLPEPETISNLTQIYELDSDGYLIDKQGAPGVWMGVGYYDVTFVLKKSRILPTTILVTAEHTALDPLDLSITIPEHASVPLTQSQYAELSDKLSNLSAHVGDAVVDYLTANPVGIPDHNDTTNRNAADAHPMNSITGLVTALAGKANDPHAHVIGGVAGLQGALNGKANAAHNHTISDTIGLQGTLDSKAPASHTHAPSDVAGTAVITTDPRLSNARTPTAHNHAGGDITTGTVAAARLPSASTTASGIVELATTAETTTGTDTTRAVTAAGVKAVADTKAASSHTHGVTDLTATGTRNATTYLRGDNTWATPDGGGGGGGVTDHGALTGLGDDDHTQYALADGSRGSFAASSHTHTAAQINDSTATGRAVLTAATQAAARTAIGAGTSNLAIGTTGTTAAAGNRAASTTAIGMVELATNTEATTGADTTRAVTPAGVKAVVDALTIPDSPDDIGAAPATQTINAKTGAYTLLATDAGKIVTLTLSAPADLTVPANVFTAGQRVDIADRGTARVTVVAGSGMTVNPPAGGSLVMEGQYAYASLVFISATEADLVGLVAAS